MLPMLPNRADLHSRGRGRETAQYVARSCLLWGVVAGISVLISYRWIDRPVAGFIHDNVRSNPEIQALCTWLSTLPDLLTRLWIVVVLSVPLLLWAIVSGRLPLGGERMRSLLIAGSGGFLLSATAKMVLKWSFGRTWPETWIYQNPSYVKDGIYGFFPFHGGAGWSSFPSGHMAAVATVAMVGWQLAPQYRAVWASLTVGAAVGLTGMNLHFVSDVIAGCYLGAASSAVALWFADAWSGRAVPPAAEHIAA